MEVAGQWRREWAGTAEYGKRLLAPFCTGRVRLPEILRKGRGEAAPALRIRCAILFVQVTEGGVTRQVARAMEVLHASGPGARVRVMRAAYHSSAGPGAPAASYLMHSSRRVISSGFNLLEPPSFQTKPLEICSKPLEISSTPLESSPESNTEGEDYKVTEPDDFDISEPSKWKSSSGGSLRMPSEESSSTDNASIIDLDSRNSHRSAFRKYSYDSENSDFQSIPSRRNSSRASPLLDAPVALSTLKYKSLLNGSNEWNNRRKSYSFEDTSPINETILHSNDTIAMESSTDSGICKSTEIVNETDKYDQKERRHDDTFQDWLSKNRSSTSFFKNSQFKSYREHDVVLEDPQENNITLQSPGKVSITVPITLEGDENYPYKKSSASDDGDRRVKRVEFCKTELHFAAESGKVNIIATDEKPPPSNDFRKRRSAFVPINANFEKPITLFGENKDLCPIETDDFSTCTRSEISESDENTAATKSILKNKIPKPKPYLLGENMVFGRSNDLLEKKDDHTSYESVVPTAVTLINRQLLQSERRYSNETTSSHSSETDTGVIKNSAFRTTNKGLAINDTLKLRKNIFESEKNTIRNVQIKETSTDTGSIKNKLKILQMSPIQGKAKTRQLRDSDLTYFGVTNSQKNSDNEHQKYEKTLRSESNRYDDIFRSVKLIQQVSNSVCNSEAESEDAPEYQNLPVKANFAPIPTPRTGLRILKPVIEQNNETSVSRVETRRSRVRRQEESITPSSRSISEPPKTSRYNSIEKLHRRQEHLRKHIQGNVSPIQSPRTRKDSSEDESININEKKHNAIVKLNPTDTISEESEPMYANFGRDRRNQTPIKRTDSTRRSTEQRRPQMKPENNQKKSQRTKEGARSDINNSSSERREKREKVKEQRAGTDKDKDTLEKKQSSIKKKQRTEKLATPDYSNESRRTTYDKSNDRRTNLSSRDKIDENNTTEKLKMEHRSRSSHRHSTSTKPVTVEFVPKDSSKAVKEDSKPLEKDILENGVAKYRTRESSKDKTSGRKESPKGRLKVNTHGTDSYRNLSSTRAKEIIIPERVPNGTSDSHRSKRSEYVINYDDKNGTVSSICKVTGSGSSKKKKILKDGPKEYKERNKTTEKIALLQFPDRQRNPKGLSYADRKWKKMHVQRSCQLL